MCIEVENRLQLARLARGRLDGKLAKLGKEMVVITTAV